MRRDHAKLATRYAKTVARIRQTRGEREYVLDSERRMEWSNLVESMLLTELSRYNPSDFDSDESDHETEAEDDENESLFPPPRSEPSSSSVVRPIRRRKKDPAAPKRPSNPFMLFAKDRRRALFDANPSATMSEVAKVLGTQWKEADAETKRVIRTIMRE